MSRCSLCSNPVSTVASAARWSGAIESSDDDPSRLLAVYDALESLGQAFEQAKPQAAAQWKKA